MLDLPNLPSAAQCAHIFPDLANNALISVGVLCDHGCIATFTKEAVIIDKGSQRVLTGKRHGNGLWYLDLNPSNSLRPQPIPHHPKANAATASTSTS